MKQCTLDDMGIGLLATWMINDELRKGKLIDCFPEHSVSAAQEPASSWLLHQNMEHLPNKCKVFRDHVITSLNRNLNYE